MRLERTIIGMVHLPPLPGSPRWDGSMARVTAVALAGPRAAVAVRQPRRALVHGAPAAALVVRGRAPGRATPLAEVKRVRSAAPEVPLLVGSGVTAETAAELLSIADGLIVGTSVKREGDVRQPVDRARVEKLVAAARRR